MNKTKILQIGLTFILVFNLFLNTAFAQVPTEMQARIDKVPEIKTCFEAKIKAKESDIKTIDETLAKCKADAETKEKNSKLDCEDIRNMCNVNNTNSTNACNTDYTSGSADHMSCLKTVQDTHDKCLENATTCETNIPNQKIIDIATCDDKANADKFKIYDTAENECNSKYARDNRGSTPGTSTFDSSKGPELKPNIGDLLYKFSYPESAEVATTDYVASLPEEETPGHILGQIIYFMLVVANILAFISFVVAGVFMIASQGNEDDNTKAKKILTYTILALIICAAALALVTGVTKINFFRP